MSIFYLKYMYLGMIKKRPFSFKLDCERFLTEWFLDYDITLIICLNNANGLINQDYISPKIILFF